jgi:hypothetical protein
MKIPRIVLAGLLVALAASQSAPAASIVGSLPVSTLNSSLLPSGADLSTVTSLSWTGTSAQSNGVGDLSIIVAGNSTGGAGTLTLASLGSFTYHLTGGTTATDYGTFTAQTAGSFVDNQTAQFLDVYLLGTFTPTTTAGAPLAGFTAGPASLRFAFTLSGPNGSLSGSATLASPPAQSPPFVPEPASLALIGIGLVSVTAFRSLRKRVGR